MKDLFINRDIDNGTEVYVVLFTNKPNNYPYAICELNLILKYKNYESVIIFLYCSPHSVNVLFCVLKSTE
jgi:hypothetical protein